MNNNSVLRGLAIDSPLISPEALNYRVPSWPPPSDFPVTIDYQGNIVSRYGDIIWNLTPWCTQALKINFSLDDSAQINRSAATINSDLARLVAAWWLWGPQSVRSAKSLKARLVALFPIFQLCSREGISASELYKFPRVADIIPRALSPSKSVEALTHLHALFEQRDILGFYILDQEGLRRLEASLPEHSAKQTPYIPPRIWAYQAGRLREFLEEFIAHQERLEKCYKHCLDAYSNYFGSLTAAYQVNAKAKSRPPSPFHPRSNSRIKETTHFQGRFSEIAKHFGIIDILTKWVIRPGEGFDSAGRSIMLLSSYLSMATKVGLAYLLNFSLMRIEEAWALRANCLEVETDETLGNIYLLKGITTKTIEDDDARWITSPSADLAVRVMVCVSRLRVTSALSNPKVPLTDEYINNPHLVVRPYEPWSNAKNVSEAVTVRPMYPSYLSIVKIYPNLFDSEKLRITESDLNVARLITTTLDNDQFKVGNTWPLAWHQLRRTGAVNMLSSGIVSDASVQYQLKHATRAMSLYYGRGHSQINFSKDARAHYLRTLYEIIGKEVAQLFSDRFVSPYGDTRKSVILNVVQSSDEKELSKAAKAGQVSWRQTLLGGCTKRGPCQYGGIDSVTRCGGGDFLGACADALFDREKKQQIQDLGKLIDARLIDAPSGSPYQESLRAQKRAVENALEILR
ncbi:hypothetical protein [Pseudomonas qingdaonensis]|uniref:hypothetical protein n=1 Tax=Pseudomonas qingdaonensis TaxID=2056231 RepID=UPI001E638B7D|nr:hypothetical protein [Pseudomonas qingdaonensis]